MRPIGTVKVLEARRRKALALLEKQFSLNEVARQIGCHASSVMRWRDLLHELGEEGLKARIPPGRPSRLSGEQKQQLLQFLLQGPDAFGWRTEVWTTQRIAELVKAKFGIVYHPDYIGRLMHSLHWSHQKPERRALERDEQAIQSWETKVWPRVKKRPKAGCLPDLCGRIRVSVDSQRAKDLGAGRAHAAGSPPLSKSADLCDLRHFAQPVPQAFEPVLDVELGQYPPDP
jgi:transposase